METFNSNYKSFVLGSVKAVTNCLDIVLYNKRKINRKISLYNLDDFYKNYLSGYDTVIHKRLSRSSYNNSFYYKSGSLEDGFNVIVYISTSSNTPLGYTEFINDQGISGNLNIDINIKRVLDNVLIPIGLDDVSYNFDIELNIRNNISDNNLIKDYSGDKLYNYVKVSEVINSNYENLYTNNTGRVSSDPRSIIYSPSSGIMDKNNFWKFKINKDINIDPYSEDYDNFRVCYYNNDLFIVGWQLGGLKYSMYSLLNKNSLGYPFVRHGETGNGIKKVLGKFYLDVEDTIRYLDTDIQVIPKSGENLIFDLQDNRGILYSLPGFFSKSELIKNIPEINNIYIDLDNYLKSNQLIIHNKIGSWFILSQRYGGDMLYLAVSPVSLIYMSSTDLDNAFFVNDQTVILKEDEYYVIYSTPGKKLYSERARLIINTAGTYEPYEDTGFYMTVFGTDDDEKHYLEYYDSGLVKIVFKYEDLYDTILNKYRRNYYPTDLIGIPEIIDSFKGLIFYKQDNIITYL